MLNIIRGHNIDELKKLPSESIQCSVTSPPYFGLRAYGTEPQTWGDGWIGELGQEPTPELFIAHLVLVFREVRRVLRNDGCCFINIGDSYAAAWPCNRRSEMGSGSLANGKREARPERLADGIKNKDLMMIPAMLAIALRADGWYLRSKITWCKKSCMPESVTDRPTNATEDIYLLTKSERYFYDSEAVKELSVTNENRPDGIARNRLYDYDSKENQLRPSKKRGDFNGKTEEMEGRNAFRACTQTRNLRNFWLLGPEPYAEAHFATFPSEIPKRCILAGTSAKGCCSECGAPWERIIEKTMPPLRKVNGTGPHGEHGLLGGNRFDEAIRIETTGWQPTCKCEDTTIKPCTVLDPFLGSGTTLKVAAELGRDGIGIELNPDYAKLAHQRTDVTPGLALA